MTEKTRPILILTGATGFIGSFIAEKALNAGFQLIALVRTNSNTTWLKSQGCVVEIADFSDASKLTELFTKLLNTYGRIDYLIHNAGITKTSKIDEFDLVNYSYTKNLVVALSAASIDLRKFILVSSLAAIGHGNEQTLEPLSPHSNPLPDTAYGKSKLKAERYIMSEPNLKWIIIRPTGVYGPKEKDYYLMLRTVQKGIAPKIGFHEQHLTFVYVTDLVDVIFLSLQSEHQRKIYLVSDGNSYTSEYYRALCMKLLNTKALKITIPLVLVRWISMILETLFGIFKTTPTLNRDKFLTLRATNWKCDIRDTITDLKYNPKYNLEEGLKACIAWYKKENWLKQS